MKENKLNWSELRKQLAKRANVEESEAGAFMTALADQIVAGLRADKQVKINGLGIFKLQPVAPRKSVNITTGEPIIIEGYNKLNFVPEAGLRELVSEIAPVSTQPEEEIAPTQDEATPLKKLSAQASEIVDLLADLGQHPIEEKEKEKEKVPEPVEPVTEPEPVAFEVKPLEMPVEPKEQEKEKKYHPLRDALITIAIILILLVIGYFFLTKQIVKFADGLLHRNDTQTEVVTPTPNVEPVVAEEVPVVERTEEAKAERVYTEFIATENLHADSRLAWLAYKYYDGKKDLWVFIYEANRDRLDNPHNITVGTPIRVPKLSSELMDLNNPKTRKLVDELIAKYK